MASNDPLHQGHPDVFNSPSRLFSHGPPDSNVDQLVHCAVGPRIGIAGRLKDDQLAALPGRIVGVAHGVTAPRAVLALKQPVGIRVRRRPGGVHHRCHPVQQEETGMGHLTEGDAGAGHCFG